MASEGWGERSTALLAILSSQRLILRVMSASVAKDNLTIQQFSVMRLIGRHGPLPMNRLSDELRVSPPNITGVVDRLEKQGLVKRVPSATDRRTKEIHLTEKGDALYRKVTKGYSEFLQQALNELTSEEQEILAKLMSKLAREIRKKER
jgi:DNA-binding MarR family transcriptional regulator